MTSYRAIAGLVALSVFVAGFLMIPAMMRADTPDSPEINKLLNQSKVEAATLLKDSGDMSTFTNSNISWEAYAKQIDLIKGHVNRTGKLLADMQQAESTGSAWQQNAIKRIYPVLKELADNTTAVIEQLTTHQSKVHMPPFRDYVKANYELSTDLESMLRDFANYGQTREKLEKSQTKLEIAN